MLLAASWSHSSPTHAHHAHPRPAPAPPSSFFTCQTCETLADTYLLFGRSLHNSPLAALAYEPSAAAVARFWRGCEDLIRCLEATGPEPTGDALPPPAGTVSPGRVRRLLLRASQLVVFGSVAAAPLLAAGVLSHWGCAPPGLGLDDLARELTRLLRAGDSGALPAAFLAAMQAAWERAGEAEPPAPGDLEEGRSRATPASATSTRWRTASRKSTRASAPAPPPPRTSSKGV